ncbi:MAG: PEP-CTERM sorting domain-containing protein [Paucibacter sp.]|nr:PEP-CTERM sorting domain-containing protein [Roseateles sp.]
MKHLIKQVAVTVMASAAILGASQNACAGLIHSYDLTSSFADLLGGPSLSAGPGTIGPSGYSFSAGNAGLTLSGALPSASTYTIEMKFALDTAANTNAWSDVLNFHNSDDELYVFCGASPDHGATSPCTLQLYPYTGAGGIMSNVVTDMIFSRDGSSNTVQAWLNGVQIISNMPDPSGFAVFNTPGNLITFFQDDTQTTVENAAGVVSSIKIFDQVYTPNNIPNGSVPEPTSIALVGLGLLGIGAARRQHAR